MGNCAAPGAHCEGVGWSGGTTSGVYYSGGGHRRKVPRSRRPLKRTEYEPISPFTLSGRLAVSLKGAKTGKPDKGVAHWFASKFGILSKQVEKYSVEEFLRRFSRFLSDTRLQNVMAVEMDYQPVYKDRNKTTTNDLDDAMAAARDYASHEDVNKVVISVLGKTRMEPRKDLHLTVEGQYYRTHGYGKPGIELRVTGIPSILLPRKKETSYEYKSREAEVARRLNSPRKREAFRAGCQRTLDIVLKDYLQHMKQVFDVETPVILPAASSAASAQSR